MINNLKPKIQALLINPYVCLGIIFLSLLFQFTELLDPNLFKAIFLFCLAILLISSDFISIKQQKFTFLFFLVVSAFVFWKSIDFYKHFKSLSYAYIIFLSYRLYLKKVRTRFFLRSLVLMSVLLGLIGLFQEYLHLIGSSFFYISLYKNPDFVGGTSILRNTSLFSEPSQFAMFLIPSVLIGYWSMLKRDFRFIKPLEFFIIGLSFVFTFSSVAFIGVFFSVAILTILSIKLNLKNVLVSLISIVMLGISILYIPIVRDKLIATQLFTKDMGNSSVMASSQFATTSFEAVRRAVLEKKWLGVGVGNYDAFISEIKTKHGINGYDDGSNLGHARIFVEFGIFGYIFLIALLFKNLATKTVQPSLRFISLIFLMSVLIILLRSGNYVNPVLYLFLSIFFKLKEEESSINEDLAFS